MVFKTRFFSKKKVAIFLSILPIFLLGFWFFQVPQRANSQIHHEQFVVVIDAGHGGIDGGVSGKTSNVKESDLNLDIAKKLKAEFEKVGIKIVMTRSTFGGLYGTTAKGFKKRDMQRRISIINGANADLMISLHLNYFSSPKSRGATTFYKEGDNQGKVLAQYIQKFLNTSSGQPRDLSALLLT